MKIAEIVEALDAKVLTGSDSLEKRVKGGGAADLMKDVQAAMAKECVLLTGLLSEETLATAHEYGVSVIVFVRGKLPDNTLIEQAEQYKIPILLTNHSLFVASGRLYIKGLRGLNGVW